MFAGAAFHGLRPYRVVAFGELESYCIHQACHRQLDDCAQLTARRSRRSPGVTETGVGVSLCPGAKIFDATGLLVVVEREEKSDVRGEVPGPV